MAHFRGGVVGNRKAATRLGSKNSGITAWANGWKTRVEIRGRHSLAADVDIFEVVAIDEAGHEVLVATISESFVNNNKMQIEVNKRYIEFEWDKYLESSPIEQSLKT